MTEAKIVFPFALRGVLCTFVFFCFLCSSSSCFLLGTRLAALLGDCLGLGPGLPCDQSKTLTVSVAELGVAGGAGAILAMSLTEWVAWITGASVAGVT